MEYAICNETFLNADHQRTCAFIASLGYRGLEVAPFTLAPLITDVTSERRRELRTQAEAEGIRIIGLHWLLAKTNGFQLTSPDEVVRQATANYLIELTRACRDLGGDLMVLGSPQQRRIPPGATYKQAEDYALDTLQRVTAELEKCQVHLCLEPLAPTETDFMQTTALGLQMMNRVNHPFVKINGIEVADQIRLYNYAMKHFHANDPNLRGPGFGDTDFLPIFQALREIKYSGYVSVEVFDYTPDPETIARQSLQYMQQCEARVRDSVRR
jgi:sugar phosphate isomerase/epimerase